MKTNPEMDRVLEMAGEDPKQLRALLPAFQSFVNYGDVKPYLHYRDKIHAVCDKWVTSGSLATAVTGVLDAYVHFCLGQNDQAEQELIKLYRSCDVSEFSDQFAIAEMVLGVSSRDKGNIDEALLHCMNMANAIKEDSLLPHFKCYANYFMAEIHMQIDDVEISGKHYKIALAQAEEGTHKIALFRSRIGLGTWYLNQKQYDESFKLFDLALKMEGISEASRARVMRDIGTYYLAVGDHGQAAEWLEKSYQLAIRNDYYNAASSSLIYLAKVYLANGGADRAVSMLTEALEISLDHMTRHKQMEIESLLSTAFKELGNYEKAFHHLQNAMQLKELVSTEKEREIFQIKNRMISDQAKAIEAERDRSDKLLLNILPAAIAAELKENRSVQPKRYEEVTVLFADFVGFTVISEQLSSEELVKTLDTYFQAFDAIIEKYGLEKIKTIGDAYMCAGGLPERSSGHAENVVRAGLEMNRFVKQKNAASTAQNHIPWKLRIGIHSGPVIAGVVGNTKFAYDIWGDTVNIASRTESCGEPGKVNISENTYDLLKDHPEFRFTTRGNIPVKGKGELAMYFVDHQP